MKEAQKGDEAAFEKLVRDQQKFVYNLALKLTASTEDALDVSQDVFLKAFINLSSFRGDSRLSVWLYRLTYNASMDYHRKNRPQAQVPLELPGDDESDQPREYPDPRPMPEEQVEKRELQRQVWEAIDSLPFDKRQILVMREFSGLSYTEIASRLQLEEGTVKSRLSRARLSLAEVLRKSGTFDRLLTSKKVKGGRKKNDRA